MKKSVKRNWIIGMILVCFFSVFAGYYICYRVNNNEKSKVEIIQDIMENEWYYGVDEEDIHKTIEDKMILGMEDLVKDPYTRYLTSLGNLADSYTGVGLSIRKYGEYQIVVEVNSNNAKQSGIEVNDVIVAINGESTKNKSLNELGELLSKKDTAVISIVKNRENIEFGTVINKEIKIESYNPITVFTKEYPNNISYVRISEFALDTATLLENYFDQLPVEYNNLILDLRGNPGGYVSVVRDVLDLFVEENKTVLATKDKNGHITYVKTMNPDYRLFNEIYVLIDSNSASGAEALSAALNYHLNGKVTLYGDTTFGKGSAQKTYYFNDGTYFHYTYALWQTPSGESINHVGVKPEIENLNTGISSVILYDRNYKLDDYDEGVKSIQFILNKLGYYTGRNHGFMDEGTVNALKSFQHDYSLEETGIVDNFTIGVFSKLMYDDECKFKDKQINDVLDLFNLI